MAKVKIDYGFKNNIRSTLVNEYNSMQELYQKVYSFCKRTNSCVLNLEINGYKVIYGDLIYLNSYMQSSNTNLEPYWLEHLFLERFE